MNSTTKPIQSRPSSSQPSKLVFRLVKTVHPRLTFHPSIPLAEPLFYPSNDVQLDEENAFEQGCCPNLQWPSEGSCFGISRSVSQSSNFSTVFRGETVRITLILFNNSDSDLGFVSVLVRLQTPDGNYCLLDSKTNPLNIFHKASSMDYPLQFLVETVGSHVLHCSAVYTDIDGQEHRTSQSYRFTVHLCLNVTANVKLVEEENDWEEFAKHHHSPVYIIDCYVYNVCQVPVYLHEIKFVSEEDEEPRSPNSTVETTAMVKDLNVPSVCRKDEEQDKSDGNETTVMNPGDCQTYTYLFYSPFNDPLQTEGRHKSASFPTTRHKTRRILGKIHASFTRFGGELANLSPALILEEPVRSHMDHVEIDIVGVPSKIYVECPFSAIVKIINRTSSCRTLYFQVRRDKVESIVPLGLSGRPLAPLQSNETCKIPVELIALEAGAHFLSGFRVVDIDSREYYEATIKEVLVHSLPVKNLKRDGM
eukprot:jgi/Galph1/4676/GphlegSOOS_G3382.1